MTEQKENSVEIKSQSDFERWVLQESHQRPVVVDFWAPWCGPCKALAPTLEKAAQEDKGSWLLAKLNTDELPDISKQFGIRSIPAVKAFQQGNIIDEFVGVLPTEQLRMWLDLFVPSEADALAEEGKVLEEQSDWPAAQAKYEAALEQKPHHNLSLLGLARLAHHQKETEQALRLLNRIHTDKDEIAQEIAQLRISIQSSGGEDVDTLQQRLKSNEQDHQARYELGLALSAQGQHEAALESLLQVIVQCRTEAPELKGKARQAMVEIFDAVGFQDPLSQKYRTRLSRELYS